MGSATLRIQDAKIITDTMISASGDLYVENSDLEVNYKNGRTLYTSSTMTLKDSQVTVTGNGSAGVIYGKEIIVSDGSLTVENLSEGYENFYFNVAPVTYGKPVITYLSGLPVENVPVPYNDQGYVAFSEGTGYIYGNYRLYSETDATKLERALWWSQRAAPCCWRVRKGFGWEAL